MPLDDSLDIRKLEERAAEELKARLEAAASLYEFFRQAWPIMEPGVEYMDNWHIGAICEHLEAVLDGEIRNLLINQPPRTLKSSTVGVALAPYAWIKRPSMKFIYGSYAYKIAEDTSVKSRTLIRSEWYQARWGDKVKIAADRDTKEYFATEKNGHRIITSVDGTLTGLGADILVVDDPNNPKDTSDTMLENALHFFKTVLPSRLNDPKTGRKIVVQQRVNERDISGYILKEMPEDWVKLILPMEFERARKCFTVPLKSTKGKKWADPRHKEGELLSPNRIPPVELARLKRALGDSYAIAGQLQQRPAPAEGGIIKAKYFRIWKEPKPPKLEFTLASWDTAMSKKEGSASSACTVWGVFHHDYRELTEWGDEAQPRDADVYGRVPNVVLLNAFKVQMEWPELRRLIKNMSDDWRDDDIEKPHTPDRRYKPDMNLIEAKANGLSLIQSLNRTGNVFTRFDPDKFGDKTNRVRLITHLLEAGRVWVPGAGPDYTKARKYGQLLIDQAIVFPRGEARDLIDTMTQALLRLERSGWVSHPGDENARPGDAEGAIHEGRPLY